MTNCEKKLLRELQDLLGTKTVKTTTNNDGQQLSLLAGGGTLKLTKVGAVILILYL